jgi:hypothetical protein
MSLTEGCNISNPVPVPQLSPYSSYHTLGAYLSPSGDNKEAFEILHRKTLDYAINIQSSTLDKESAM